MSSRGIYSDLGLTERKPSRCIWPVVQLYAAICATLVLSLALGFYSIVSVRRLERQMMFHELEQHGKISAEEAIVRNTKATRDIIHETAVGKSSQDTRDSLVRNARSIPDDHDAIRRNGSDGADDVDSTIQFRQTTSRATEAEEDEEPGAAEDAEETDDSDEEPDEKEEGEGENIELTTGRESNGTLCKKRSARETTPGHRGQGKGETNGGRQSHNGNKRTGKQKKKQSKNKDYPSLAAIHLQAPDNIDRQYESGPMVSLNASVTKDTVYRFWRKASWVTESITDVFHLDETTGHVTVEVEGVYLVYAQMVYHDLSGRWSFGIYVGDQEKVKCLATEQLRELNNYHPTSHGVYQNCYTAIVLHVRKNQSVSIRCMYGSRTILTRSEFTFWGIVRLS